MKLRKKMPADGLRRYGITNRIIRAQVLKDAGLERRIRKAIGDGLPTDVKQDAVSDLYLAVLDCQVGCEHIEKVAPSYRNRAFGLCGSRFGPRSLDEELGDDFTLGDLLEDPDAFDQILRSAEIAFDNDNRDWAA